MRPWVVIALATVIVVTGFLGFRAWQFYSLWQSQFPTPSSEETELTSAKRALLTDLRGERKFQPHSYPPLGYTGAETSEDAALGTEVVNDVIDAVLSHPDGPLPAKIVSDLIGKSMRRVNLLATEDRDRVQGYMLEVWYLLGFTGATGRFAYGGAFGLPPGYGEPLPPGWTSPTEPRPLDR